MIAIMLSLLLLIVGLLALALQRFYSSIPILELKRLSRKGDPLAQALYKAAAYEASLRSLLWLIAVLALAGGLILIFPAVPNAVDFGIVALVLLVALVWLPSARLTVHAAHAAGFMAPALVAVLQRTHGFFDALARLGNKTRELAYHTRLYEKEDLARLLSHQKQQPDNRISLPELELAHRALQFSDKKASAIAASRTKIRAVNAEDSIGPILLDQLHKSGQPSFLVYKDDPENVVGSLLMRDAVNAKHGGRVIDLIRSDLCYVHEDFSLRQVLAAFQKTGHHTAIVINEFEEFVGIITLDRLIQELVGAPAAETDDNFEDRTAIAAFKQGQLGTEKSEASTESELSAEVPDAISPDTTPAEASTQD